MSFKERSKMLQKMITDMLSLLNFDNTIRDAYKDVSLLRGFEKHTTLVLIGVMRAIESTLKRLLNVVIAAERRYDVSQKRVVAIEFDKQQHLERLQKEEKRARKQK